MMRRRDLDKYDTMSQSSKMSNVMEQDERLKHLANRVIGNMDIRDLEKDILRDYH